MLTSDMYEKNMDYLEHTGIGRQRSLSSVATIITFRLKNPSGGFHISSRRNSTPDVEKVEIETETGAEEIPQLTSVLKK